MKIPSYIQDLLRTKKHREIYVQHPKFCRGVIAPLRFLVDEHGFALSDITQQCRELWITLKKRMPIPLRKPKHLDTYVELTVETEYFNSTCGAISLRTERIIYPALRSFSFEQIHDRYSSTPYVAGGKLKDQLKEVSRTAELLNANWLDILHRLTRNIPSRKIV